MRSNVSNKKGDCGSLLRTADSVVETDKKLAELT